MYDDASAESKQCSYHDAWNDESCEVKLGLDGSYGAAAADWQLEGPEEQSCSQLGKGM